MSILQEILNWSQGLAPWQSDAIARLFIKGTLSEEDINDLFALLKSEHGISDPDGRTPSRLSADQIPSPAKSDTSIKLIAMKNLRHVNKIAETNRLSFGFNGLTVIYGDNGSGKSGYSRVLKRACRARDQKEPIHPNAFLPIAQTGKAEASFEICIDGVSNEFKWVDGEPSPAVLSSLSVFDSSCARSYLDEEGDFSYVPYGLDILEGLGKACKQLKQKVEAEITISEPDTTLFDDLLRKKISGEVFSVIFKDNNPERIEELATTTPEMETKRDLLSKSLGETNPKEKSSQLNRLANRIDRLVQSISEKHTLVDDIAIKGFKNLRSDYDKAQEAANIAANEFKDDANFLPGTGGTAWKELFTAARKFSLEAYPGRVFPVIGTDAQCLLCQQPLADAGDRLVNFNKFIQQEAEKKVEISKEALDAAISTFMKQNVQLSVDEELYTELDSLDKTLPIEVKNFADYISSRYSCIKMALTSGEWDCIQASLPCPSERLKSLSGKLRLQATTLEKLIDEQTRSAMQDELDEILDIEKLIKAKPYVLAAIKLSDKKLKLKKCLSSVKTNAISAKASELAEKIISKKLEEALNAEFNKLGVENLKVCLTSRIDRGKPIHKLKLDLPQNKTLAGILSEGEQRAIAIGSFLAEINIGEDSSGIIFDDPVSSLDHKRRERVARRLSQEAAKRQVIVFTHDLYFVSLLSEEAENAGISIEKCTLWRRQEGYGVVDSDLPFEGKDTKGRIEFLLDKHKQLGGVFDTGDDQEYRRLTTYIYQQLRLAWERAIEEVLLHKVVLRFRKGIQTDRLAGVVVEDSDYDIVYAGMTKCSNYAHDTPMLGSVALPNPQELLDDIIQLKTWINDTKKRRNVTEDKRKKHLNV